MVTEFQKQSHKHSTTASVGVHIFKVEELLLNAKTPEDFEKAFGNEMMKADNATYAAKNEGKNCLQVSKEYLEFYKLESKASK